ncbi:S-protein homolog 2-like [Cicer arietinum]|uniref:S-protein homolog n=1 Tax=Cicer arietinum TaxID=3827 RepID=A0A1S2Z269_CICAR|nr:S-protein homolog 2-like [Cicer arietinum]
MIVFVSFDKGTFAFESREDFSINPKVHVVITNGLDAPTTSKNITVHCKSKDDDLGFHTLMFGESWDFTFRPLVFPRWQETLFFCSFTWPKDPLLHYLDVYNQKKDECIECLWKITSKGGCKYNSNLKKYDVCVPWKSVQVVGANNSSKI